MNKHYQIEQVQIQSTSIIDMWGDDVLKKGYGGFTPFADNLTLYFNELKLTSKELRLILTVLTLQRRNIVYITDKKIDPMGTNFKKARKSLKEKKYLETKRFMVDTAEGKRCLGTIYNFEGLKKRIVELAIAHDKLKVKENIDYEKSKQENKNQNSATPSTSKEKNNTTKNEAQNKYDELILKNFLSAYCKMHKELLNIELNFNKKTKQKEYVVKIYESIDAKKVDYKDVLEKARSLFEKLGDIGKTSLAFQDTVARAVAFINSKKNTASNTVNDKTKKSIPSAESLFGRNKK